MADNVQFQSTQLATPASGTTVSTDEAASGHIQRVKLAYSADGVDTHVTADASGLLINPGNAHIDAIHDAMSLTDQAIAVKAAIFGHNSGGAGSYEPVKVTPSGALTVEVNDGGGSITVDGTVAATQSGTWTVGVSGTATNIAGQSTVSNSSATIASARAGRRAILITNYQTIAVYIDPAGGTATTSMYRLDPGASIVLPTATAITGITSAAYSATGDAKVHYIEVY